MKDCQLGYECRCCASRCRCTEVLPPFREPETGLKFTVFLKNLGLAGGALDIISQRQHLTAPAPVRVALIVVALAVIVRKTQYLLVETVFKTKMNLVLIVVVNVRLVMKIQLAMAVRMEVDAYKREFVYWRIKYQYFVLLMAP